MVPAGAANADEAITRGGEVKTTEDRSAVVGSEPASGGGDEVKALSPAGSSPAVAGSRSEGALTFGGGDVSLIRKAAALRVKYRKHPELVRIPVMQIGAHPDNRDGQGPSGSRCLELTGKILKVGFDAVEADSNGVLIEQKPGGSHIRDANARFADGDALLAPTSDGLISYGTLSHSTLNQLMRNIHARCAVGSIHGGGGDVFEEVAASTVVESDVSRIVDSTGRLSIGLLQQIDPAFASAIHSGLLWEVLSSAIEEEEPDGCAVIQAALNAKNGLFLVCHEMQALSRLMTLVGSPTVVGKQNQWQFVVGRMRETMPQFCDDKNFLDMYAFVADMGADGSKFLHDLKEFHQKFVNPQVRRLRLDAFAVANLLPLEMPHLKVAFVKHLYVEGKLAHGFCLTPSIRYVKCLADTTEGQTASAVAEDILRFFHVTCRAAIEKLDHGMRTKFFGNLDKDIFAKLANADDSSGRESAVRMCGTAYHKRLTRMVTGEKVPAFTHGGGEMSAGATSAAAPTMQPKVIVYDEAGRPLTRQDQIVTETLAEEYGWSAFMQTSCMVDMVEETCIKSMILTHIHLLHQQLPTITDEHVKSIKGGTRGGGVHVVAAKAMKEGELRMAPLITGPSSLSRLQQTQSSPYVLNVKVQRKGAKSEWFLTGQGNLPPASTVVEKGGKVVNQHAWASGHNPWPLWHAKRVHLKEESNCAFIDVDVRNVSTFQPTAAPTVVGATKAEAFADNYDIVVPVFVNTQPLAEGEELRVLWTAKALSSKSTRASQITWASQARTKLGKQQRTK